jgi:hypothetical protein
MQPWDVVAAAGLAAVSTVSVALWTLRVALAARGRRLAASGTASVEALLFVAAFGRVLDALDEPLHLLSYAVGVAAGTFVGLTLETRAEERRMSVGRTSGGHSPAVEERLAEEVDEAGHLLERCPDHRTAVEDVEFAALDDTRALEHRLLPSLHATGVVVDPLRAALEPRGSPCSVSRPARARSPGRRRRRRTARVRVPRR